MKKVLLTGATGFIGRQCIIPLLDKGYEVHAVHSHTDPCLYHEHLYWHQVNLLESAQLKKLITTVKPSHLLHFAWYAIPSKYWTAKENFVWLQSSIELLRLFAQENGQRVVIAGTCAEYDWQYGYCSENTTPLVPSTPYGKCKQALQQTLEAFSTVHNLSSAWGRIFFLYGTYEYPARLVSSVINSLLRGQPANCSHGEQIRDFLYVEDVADAFVTLLDSHLIGAINIGSGQPTSIKNIVTTIAHQIGRPDLLKLGILPSTANEPTLLLPNTMRLKQELGWQAQYDLTTGLEQTINWWKTRL
ncbi:nucleoside-diphosphate-sugar epimerase [Beggiatoa alba B18LD]|uniref:Nucleoside-diphosphate-sugar epimerase n=1 Tax=Beggiatoa alba B18LD TaxID=395493 RepID=I3CHN2_9GAMM|nr:NAD(P)-dependent oxidoreductase [Beggiatoa alba]EIJ43125.1 nucleoside-diphosphate-sugar epimerase [Beggiatoa alba B18LD]